MKDADDIKNISKLYRKLTNDLAKNRANFSTSGN